MRNFEKGGDAHCGSAFLTQLEVELGFEGELVGVGAAEVCGDVYIYKFILCIHIYVYIYVHIYVFIYI